MRKILIFILVVATVAGFLGYDYYQQIYSPSVPAQLKTEFLHIPTGSNFEDVSKLLAKEGFIEDQAAFDWVADKMSYQKAKIRAGRFQIKPKWSNRKVIQHLRSGKQAPVKLTFSTARFPREIAGKAATFIEADSSEIIQLLNNKNFLQDEGYATKDIMTLFIPNTYEFFWNTNAEQFFERMKKEHKIFWEKDNRLAKAKKLKMTPKEVYTLASIVERESQNKSERPTIAGLYLNRIRKGMRLEADPTVVFANNDFTLRRVLNKHLAYDSPYNTYLYKGLPPGPISLASISSIDAVLNEEKHDYIFMCAKVDAPGSHAFAKTLAGHNINARKYRNWLNKQGIR